MYELRDYQTKAVNTGIEFFNSNDKSKPILVLPTGSGKSIIIAIIAKAFPDKKILVLQPSIELLVQNYQKYENVTKDNIEFETASVFSAGAGEKQIGRITFATIGSIYKLVHLFTDIDICIVDECHSVPPNKEVYNKKFEQISKDSMYISFFKYLPNIKIIGLTATPFRLKTYNDPFNNGQKYSQINLLTRERPLFFNKFLHVTQIKELYDQGYLCPINYIQMNWDGTKLKVNSTGAEYTDKSLKEAIERNEIIQRIPNILAQAFQKGRRACLVFVISIEEAKYLASITPFSAYLYADMNKAERQQIIQQFKKGGIKTIFNVGILTTGFDYPELDTVILARPTMSLTLYIQMVGRGIRIAKGKEKLALVDMCGNVDRFGKIEELRIEDDPLYGWVLRNDKKIISGKRLDEI